MSETPNGVPENQNPQTNSEQAPDKNIFTMERARKVASKVGTLTAAFVVATIEYKIGTLGHDIWEEPVREAQRCGDVIIHTGQFLVGMGGSALDLFFGGGE